MLKRMNLMLAEKHVTKTGFNKPVSHPNPVTGEDSLQPNKK